MKKILKLSLVVCLFVCLNINTSAQTNSFRFGVKAGLNLSTASVSDASESKYKSGYQFGTTVEYSLSKNFLIQSGLFFSAEGSKIEDMNMSNYQGLPRGFTNTVFNQLYLELPLYGTYKMNISDNLNIAFGIGPYFGYGIGGKSKLKLNNGYVKIEIEWDTFGDEFFNYYYDGIRNVRLGESLNRSDFGVGFKVDVGYYNYVLGIGLTSGIIDIAKKQQGYSEYKNKNINISIGYKF